MSDIVASIFALRNTRFLLAPKTEFYYEEKGTAIRWQISAGGTRAYAVRFGAGIAAQESASIDSQNADSQFMIDRLKCALLFGGHGLFHAEAVGRLFIQSVQETPSWFTQLNLPLGHNDMASAETYDWLKAFTSYVPLRRAAMDAHAALSNPHEAGFFVYRGLEWLVVAEKRRWHDLAADIGVTTSEIDDFKKLANVDYGVRHASRSGKKLRADAEDCGTLVCALFDAIIATRARYEPGYVAPAPEVVAGAIRPALPADPYP